MGPPRREGEDAHSQPFAKSNLLLGIIRGKRFAILVMSSITEIEQKNVLKGFILT